MKEFTVDSSHIKLYNEDCFNILNSLDDNSIDLIVTDPPYNLSFKDSHSNYKEKDWDKFTSKEYTEFMAKWLNLAYDKLKDNGQLWFFFGPSMIREVLSAVDKTKYIEHLENYSVMARGKGRGSKNKLKSLREDYMHLTKSKDYTWNSIEFLRRVIANYHEKGGKPRGWFESEKTKMPVRFTGLPNVTAWCSEYPPLTVPNSCKHRGSILDIASGERLYYDGEPSDVTFYNSPYVIDKFQKTIHGCQKPVLLLLMLIMMCSKKGDTVLDLFMGSGSTGIASILSERNFIGIEREEEVFNKAENWMKNINYKEAENYIKEHVHSTENNFKFGIN